LSSIGSLRNQTVPPLAFTTFIIAPYSKKAASNVRSFFTFR
jgi:hypothetical protein